MQLKNKKAFWPLLSLMIKFKTKKCGFKSWADVMKETLFWQTMFQSQLNKLFSFNSLSDANNISFYFFVCNAITYLNIHKVYKIFLWRQPHSNLLHQTGIVHCYWYHHISHLKSIHSVHLHSLKLLQVATQLWFLQG